MRSPIATESGSCPGGEVGLGGVARRGRARRRGVEQHRHAVRVAVGDRQVGLAVAVEIPDRHRAGSSPGGEVGLGGQGYVRAGDIRDSGQVDEQLLVRFDDGIAQHRHADRGRGGTTGDRHGPAAGRRVVAAGCGGVVRRVVRDGDRRERIVATPGDGEVKVNRTGVAFRDRGIIDRQRCCQQLPLLEHLETEVRASLAAAIGLRKSAESFPIPLRAGITQIGKQSTERFATHDILVCITKFLLRQRSAVVRSRLTSAPAPSAARLAAR